MLQNIKFIILFIVLAMTGGALKAVAANAATLKGRVLNPDGAVIAGAKVKLSNPNTGRIETATTGADGVFNIYNIPHNPYVLTIEAEGYAQHLVNLDIHSDLPTDLGDIRLELAALSASVD